MIHKPTARPEHSEQRQHQSDLSRSSDSINDQQWHMVSSNRGLRKGTTTSNPNRRETTDESQTTTTKTNKTSSNHTGKNIIYHLCVIICVMNNFIFYSIII